MRRYETIRNDGVCNWRIQLLANQMNGERLKEIGERGANQWIYYLPHPQLLIFSEDFVNAILWKFDNNSIQTIE